MIRYLSYIVYYVDIVVYSLCSLFCFIWRWRWKPIFSSTWFCGVGLRLRVGFYVSGTRILIVVTSTSRRITLSTTLRNQRLVIGRSEVLQPWISPQFLRCWSVFGFVLHTLGDYSSGASWHMVRDCQVTSLYFAVQVFVVLASERKLTTEESKEQDSTCIDVRWWSAVFCLLDYFRSHVRRSSTKHFDPLIIWNACAESEIYQLDISSFIKHYIL